MAYSKQTWTNGTGGGTPVSAARLQHIEDGLETAADFLIAGSATTATAAGTTTLTNADKQVQLFTGSTTHTVKLPTTGVVAGQAYTIINNSTGAVTVQSSGANTVLIMIAARTAVFVARTATPTAAADWDVIGLTGSTNASTLGTAALRDNNGIISANAYISRRQAVATSAGTTTLSLSSGQVQEFTGSTTHTVKLPTTSLLAGMRYTIINNSTGDVTVQSSGANTISTLTTGTQKDFVVQVDTPTTAAHWRAI